MTDDVVLLRVYPKRGPQGTVDLLESEYLRLIAEFANENQTTALHQVDITNLLADISGTARLS